MNREDAVKYEIIHGGFVEEWDNAKYDEDGNVVSGRLIGIRYVNDVKNLVGVKWKDKAGMYHIEVIGAL
jgi:hypothetical protein